MSNFNHISTPFACPCDEWVHPQPLDIPAGLSAFRRQIATFPDFRRAMLAEIRNHYPLNHWQARESDDLGVMLLEMWAYVCDSLAFYDEVIAHEAYLRTARQRPALRKLTALLGYLPRPAVAATVQLAALAAGRKALSLPAGTAFRSGAFAGEPPQVFELENETLIHPFTNQWEIKRVYPQTMGSPNPQQLLVSPTAAITRNTLVFIRHTTASSYHQAVKVAAVNRISGTDEKIYTQLELTQATSLAAGTQLNQLELHVPTQTASLWTTNQPNNSIDTSGTYAKLVLESANSRFKPGQYILLTWDNHLRWGQIQDVGTVKRDAVEASILTINGNTFHIPGAQIALTELTLYNTGGSNSLKNALATAAAGAVTVHYGMQYAGKVVRDASTQLAPTDPLLFSTTIESPLGSHNPGSFLLQDLNETGAAIGGELDLVAQGIVPSDLSRWQENLYAPVKAFGNVLTASRGESVWNEVLGSGDASQANLSFKLNKKPLTYLLSPTTENGTINTLQVYVDGIRWSEVPNFYLAGSEDAVYIVRQDDDGESYVHFGDGKRGQRLPSGNNNVVANYRFGAGAAAPPAGSVNQIAKPVEGLQSVKNPLAASGGADAEPASEMRSNAPASALILGRAVSIKDMEAVALAIPGVRVVQAQWRWHGEQQRPVVHLWYVGENGMETTISERLRNVSDPATPFQVEQAQAVAIALHLGVWVDPRYDKPMLLEAIHMQLLDPKTGLLMPEQLGIGQPCYRSRLYEAVLAVAGSTSVQQVNWNRVPLTAFAKSPGAGRYFDFETTPPAITLTEDPS